MEQYPVLKRSGNARLARKVKRIRHLPSQAVGMRPAFSKAVVELTNAPKTETLRKHMKAQRDLEQDFAENAARAQQLRRRSAKKFLPGVVHSEPAIHQPRPSERRVIRFGVARRSFLPPHQVPLRHYCDVRLNPRVRGGSLPSNESIGVFAGRFPLKIHA